MNSFKKGFKKFLLILMIVGLSFTFTTSCIQEEEDDDGGATAFILLWWLLSQQTTTSTTTCSTGKALVITNNTGTSATYSVLLDSSTCQSSSTLGQYTLASGESATYCATTNYYMVHSTFSSSCSSPAVQVPSSQKYTISQDSNGNFTGVSSTYP